MKSKEECGEKKLRGRCREDKEEREKVSERWRETKYRTMGKQMRQSINI